MSFETSMVNRIFLLAPALLALLAGAGCAGNVNDALAEARRGDPEGIREAAVRLGQLLRQKEEADYPYDTADLAAVEYLKEVSEKGADAINRAAATSSLGGLSRPQLNELFLKKLEDSSWIVQKEAVRAISKRPRPEASEPLAQKLKDDIRLEVRLEIIKALAACGGEPGLRALLAVFLDGGARYKNMKLTAYDGIVKLSGQSIPFEETQKWRDYQSSRFPEDVKKDEESEGP